MAMQTKACACGKPFQTSNDSSRCYDCTLAQITGGMPPEEGDFNSAALQSGSMTEAQRRAFQRDLMAVELGYSSAESMGSYPIVEEDECDDAYRDLDDGEDDDPDDVQLIITCKGDDKYYHFAWCDGEETSSSYARAVDELKADHDKYCGCAGDVQISRMLATPAAAGQ
jgi:hypothetical protein